MTKKQRNYSDGDCTSDESVILTGSSSHPDKKRRRLNMSNGSGSNELIGDCLGDDVSNDVTESAAKRTVDPVLFEQAKNRLSKFAARLFDPNRTKGLVEAPFTIPLNDEFLKAFGKREKEMDQLRGRDEVFDTEIVDEDDNEKDIGKESTIIPSKAGNKKKQTKVKVKINNLAYRTTEDALTKACLRFGALTDVHLILEGPVASNRNFHNSGRAYVTFETEDGAQSCLEGLKTLDRRPLRLSMAAARPKNPKGNDGRVTSASLLNIRSTKDISTVCFRCKQVGHMESDCPNSIIKKPCILCGMTDHEMRACPNNKICFNCGTPGHVSRDCMMRRGLPRRMVCGICFQSGHHRLQCRMQSAHDLQQTNVVSPAICMECGSRGHFLCKDLKWFYGLRGMSCFNCGSQEHSGYDCERPTLYQCLNNPDTATEEIDRAEADSVAEEFERQRREQRETSRNRGRNGDKRSNSTGSRRDRRGY